MSGKCSPSSTPPGGRRRSGLTLTEVVAGLVLLTTVLSAVFVARGRFLRQHADADRQLAAARAADAMIGQWLAGPADRVPLRGEGELPGVKGCQWTTRPISDATAASLGAIVVRLEVTQIPDGVTSRRDRNVLAVEFLLPDAKAEGEE